MFLLLRRIETKLDQVIRALGIVERNQINMSNAFNDAETQLLAQVDAQVTLESGVLALLQSIEAQAQDALTQDPQTVLAALAKLKNSAAAMSAALLANTPHAPDPVVAPVAVAPVAVAPVVVAPVADPVVAPPVEAAAPVVVADPVVADPVVAPVVVADPFAPVSPAPAV